MNTIFKVIVVFTLCVLGYDLKSQNVEIERVISDEQSVFFNFLDNKLSKIVDIRRLDSNIIYKYVFHFTKSRLDSVVLDFNPSLTFIKIDKNKGVQEIIANSDEGNLIHFAPKDTNNIIPDLKAKNPKYFYLNKKCFSEFKTNTNIEPHIHEVKIVYNICQNGQVKFINENNWPYKNGFILSMNDKNFIKDIETYKDDKLNGVHIVLNKVGKLKFMFITINGVRYNMMNYSQLLKLKPHHLAK